MVVRKPNYYDIILYTITNKLTGSLNVPTNKAYLMYPYYSFTELQGQPFHSHAQHHDV